MAKNNKVVYLFELDYDTTIGIDKMHAHNVVGIFEDKDEAVKTAMANCDSGLDEDDVLEGLDYEGYVEIWGHPMKVGEHYATHVVATVTEHVLITKDES